MKKKYYWDKVSEKIATDLLIKYFRKEMRICEVGCGGGHFLQFLNEKGYENLIGVEIRTEQYEVTKREFERNGLKVTLINANILDVQDQYDALYSTGLLQCLNNIERACLIEHVSKLAPLAIFIVPEINNDRNLGSKLEVAVDGCEEYSTGNLLYELSQFYSNVKSGVMDKKQIDLKDNFIYFVCRNRM